MKETIRQTLYKNRYLMLTAGLLILGAILGVTALANLPTFFSEKICAIVMTKNSDFQKIWCDHFLFSELLMIGLFLSGFNLFGHGTGSFFLLLYGIIYGVKTAANYRMSGSDYLITALVEFCSFLVFAVFCLLTMCEKSFYSSENLYKAIRKNDDKSHFNAKNQVIEFIVFTIILAVFSVLSTYLFLIFA